MLSSVLAVAALSQSFPAFRSNVELVVVPCTVVDKNGVAVRNLSRDEFRVYDNDTRRPIENFSADDNPPLTLGVILDASESQQAQLAEHRRTAIELLTRIRRPGDRAFVVSVDEEIRLWADLTETISDVRTKLQAAPGELFGEPCPMQRSSIPGVKATSACGPSPLWDAIYNAARLKLHGLPGGKALLMLTDGFDTGSAHTWRQAADAVNSSGASLYAIQYRSAFGRNYAPDLYRLAADAGGATFDPPAGEYDQIISRLETDLRRRYVLGFRPELLSGKLKHEIRVEVTRPDLTVRARQTYFQEPE